MQKLETFLKVNKDLLSNKTLNHTEKNFISYVMAYQLNGLECYESTASIANNLGLEVRTLRTLITKFNNLYKSFFLTENPTNTTHIFSIDIDNLNKFIQEGTTSTPNKKVVKVKKSVEDIAYQDMQEEYFELIDEKYLPVPDYVHGEFTPPTQEEIEALGDITINQKKPEVIEGPKNYIAEFIQLIEDNGDYLSGVTDSNLDKMNDIIKEGFAKELDIKIFTRMFNQQIQL